MSKILVSGANGFVGRALCSQLIRNGHDVVGAVRGRAASGQHSVGDLSDSTDWRNALAGVEVVVHLAARVHMLRDNAVDPLAQFRAVNRDATLNLARQAAAAGVRRFIFISSIGVNGAETISAPFDESTVPRPHSPYAVSKWEAECELNELCADGAMELVILRPPLVYGSNAPGNFATLLKLVRRALPMPLGAVENRRSMISLDNLVEVIIGCATSPAAANQLFLVSDGDDVSTPALLTALAEGMGRPARLWWMPIAVLRLGARLAGRSAMYQQLCGSLCIDSSKMRSALQWRPALSTAEALQRIGREFLKGNNK